ncbi:MAG TPA: HEAT repeat domain-containing protein [Gemmatimonadaceae bacterium]|nr:HEAT repeat domain-containing protein [Gemmatimonadaceae bacterium]
MAVVNCVGSVPVRAVRAVHAEAQPSVETFEPRNKIVVDSIASDSLFQEARTALFKGDFSRAALLFQQVRRYRGSTAASNAGYWEAFARYKIGGSGQLLAALAALDDQRKLYPEAATTADVDAFLIRVLTQLDRTGDRTAHKRLQRIAASVRSVETCVGLQPPAFALALRYVASQSETDAVKLTDRLVAPNSKCPLALRRNALVIAADVFPAAAEKTFRRVVASNAEVSLRRAAVFGLGRVPNGASLALLEQLARSQPDTTLRTVALAAIADQGSAQARAVLFRYVNDVTLAVKSRGTAIILLSERGRKADLDALKGLFEQSPEPDIRQAILTAISQNRTLDNARWLAAVSRQLRFRLNERKIALLLGAEAGLPSGELGRLADGLSEDELRKTVLAMLSQRDDKEALQQLERIAETDRSPALRSIARILVGEVRARAAARVPSKR